MRPWHFVSGGILLVFAAAFAYLAVKVRQAYKVFMKAHESAGEDKD